MKGWLRHLELTVKSKTGLGADVLVWALLAVLGAAATLGFLISATFIGLAERYGPLTAALALGGLFLAITIVASACCLASQRRTVASAKLELAARSHALWLDPNSSVSECKSDEPSAGAGWSRSPRSAFSRPESPRNGSAAIAPRLARPADPGGGPPASFSAPRP